MDVNEIIVLSLILLSNGRCGRAIYSTEKQLRAFWCSLYCLQSVWWVKFVWVIIQYLQLHMLPGSFLACYHFVTLLKKKTLHCCYDITFIPTIIMERWLKKRRRNTRLTLEDGTRGYFYTWKDQHYKPSNCCTGLSVPTWRSRMSVCVHGHQND